MAKKRHLGEILYRLKYVDKEIIKKAILDARKTGQRLGEFLIEKEICTEEQVTKALSKQFGLEYINLEDIQLNQATLKLVPKEIMTKHNVLPLGEENGKLKIIICDPMDLDTLDMLRFRLNTELICCMAPPSRVKAYILKNFDEVRSSIDATAQELKEEGLSLEEEIKRAAEAEDDDEGPVIRLVNLIIDEAYRIKASDIHIEPMADRVKVRYRIDGRCKECDAIPKNMQSPIIARLKILSGMDIAERRIPQDGRIKRNIDGTDIDFRVSALPAYHGESVVLRILRPDAVNIGIPALGLEDVDYQKFQNIIKKPNGIFLVTGPTGSGKTTTLYAALQTLNRPDIKIITAEDPVEYNFAGMNQCQIRADIGLTFEKILRSMLRQSPNIILIGEIRDGIVADIAIQAALTGHLVFSTLHTNDAPGAITRLIDMGIKPFLAASAIQAILAQRLVRKICQSCKEVDENPNPQYLRLLNIKPEDLKTNSIYKGKGCSKCNGAGYKGRVGIFELMELNREIRELAFARATAGEIRKAARASGMRTLLEDGKAKIFKGITTPEEVARTSQAEGLVVD